MPLYVARRIDGKLHARPASVGEVFAEAARLANEYPEIAALLPDGTAEWLAHVGEAYVNKMEGHRGDQD